MCDFEHLFVEDLLARSLKISTYFDSLMNFFKVGATAPFPDECEWSTSEG